MIGGSRLRHASGCWHRWGRSAANVASVSAVAQTVACAAWSRCCQVLPIAGQAVASAQRADPYDRRMAGVDLVADRAMATPRSPGPDQAWLVIVDRHRGQIRMADDIERTPDDVIDAFESDIDP